MTRIDFYVLPENAAPTSGVVMTACKLCDKASTGGSRVFVHVPEAALAQALDSALWSFRQGSFIGHERLAEAAPEAPLPAVLIGDSEPPSSYQAVLINLGLDVPAYFSRFERVLEIVDGDAVSRARSREHYKYYRDRGYELTMHNL